MFLILDKIISLMKIILLIIILPYSDTMTNIIANSYIFTNTKIDTSLIPLFIGIIIIVNIVELFSSISYLQLPIF